MAQRRSKPAVSGSQGESKVFSFRLPADQAVQLNTILKRTNQSLAALVSEQIVTPPQARPAKQQAQSFAAIKAQQREAAAVREAWIRKSQDLDKQLLVASAFQQYLNVWTANRFLSPENFNRGDAERFARHMARVSLGRATSEGRKVQFPATIEISVPGFQKPFPVRLTQNDKDGRGIRPAEWEFIEAQDLANRWRQQMGV